MSIARHPSDTAACDPAYGEEAAHVKRATDEREETLRAKLAEAQHKVELLTKRKILDTATRTLYSSICRTAADKSESDDVHLDNDARAYLNGHLEGLKTAYRLITGERPQL